MKVAIPTSDRITVFKRTGHTTEFAICEITDGSYEFIEFRTNPPHVHHHEEGDENHGHEEVVALLNDCDALLVLMAGKHFKQDFEKANIPIYKTNESDLKEAISNFALDMLSHNRL